MKKLTNWLRWLDDNIIRILVAIFVFVVPLYPKLPIRMINYTYIALRAEDFFVAAMLLVFALQLLRNKISLDRRHLVIFILFWGAAFLSFVYGTFIMKTIEFKHLGILHTLRRIEYMSVFFVAASTIRSKKDLYFYLKLTFIALFIVFIYGMGQKFMGWPAVQTMNPEFAKGRILYLTPEARVSSTFGGHYDLAAYLVFLIPIIIAYSLYKKWFLFVCLYVASLLLLIMTASRISFIAYVLSTATFLIFIRKPKYLVFAIASTALLMVFSNSMLARFLKTIQVKQIFVNQKTGQVVVPEKITSKELPAGTFYVELKKDQVSSTVAPETESILKERLLDDLRDVASKSGKTLTSSEEASLIATMSANLKPVDTVVSDISFATRLQVEWPRAVKAFLKNPILGTGPSSITEATDNDYLRWIGEFGLLGTGLFLYILFSIALFVWKRLSALEEELKILYIGFLFALGGLMINASYIDVFEASKVAYFFWLTSGFFIGYLYSVKISKKKAAK